MIRELTRHGLSDSCRSDTSARTQCVSLEPQNGTLPGREHPGDTPGSGPCDTLAAPKEVSVQIGVDIGGTFTDIVALDRAGLLALTKVPSTPKDLLEGIGAAVSRVLELAGARPADVERFIPGTTVATNA